MTRKFSLEGVVQVVGQGQAIGFDVEGDRDVRGFVQLAYTGAVVHLPGPFGLERVIFDIDGITPRLARTPIFKCHDSKLIVGISDDIQKTEAGLEITGRLFRVTQAGKEVADLADNGFPWQASIGLQAEEQFFVEAGESAPVNGQEFEGPGVVVRRGELVESSFVPSGADSATSSYVLEFSGGPKMAEKNLEADPEDEEDKDQEEPAELQETGPDEDEDEEEKEEKEMSAAGIAELRAEFDNSDFVLSQLEGAQTMAQARASWKDIQIARLHAEVDTLQKQLTAQAKMQASIGGADPMPQGSSDGASTGSFRERALAYQAQHGCSLGKAYSWAASCDPEGYKSTIATRKTPEQMVGTFVRSQR